MAVDGSVPLPRVLVVECDDALRTTMRTVLSEHGFEVTAIRNGAMALEHTDERPDAIVIDVTLPDTDGRDLCRAMRALGSTAPVLFVTTPEAIADRMTGFG